MKKDTVILIGCFITSSILGIIIVLSNILLIPAGHEMGAIAETILTLFFAGLIYFFTIIVSIFSWNVAGNRKIIILIITHSLSILLISFSSWRICFYSKPQLTLEERDIEKSKRDSMLNSLLIKIPSLKKNGYINRPNNSIYKKDSTIIIDSLRSLFNTPYNLMDSAMKIKIVNLIDFNIYTFFRESSFTINYLEFIKISLTIKDIYYSPDLQTLLAIIIFNVDNGSDALVLIGRKYDNQIKLYKYYHYNYPDYSNAGIAYAACFKHLNGIDEDYSSCSRLLDKEFWSCKYIFDKYPDGNSFLYTYQVELKYNSNDYKKRTPIFDIKYN